MAISEVTSAFGACKAAVLALPLPPLLQLALPLPPLPLLPLPLPPLLKLLHKHVHSTNC